VCRIKPAFFRGHAPVLGILRGIPLSAVEPLAETSIRAGLGALEITMNSVDAPDLIQALVKVAGDRINVGAGTVLSMADLNVAVAAGAAFVVSPVCDPELISAATQMGVDVIPGALTPSEIQLSWRSGASIVKVFPAARMGPDYFSELRGPLADVPLMAVGGVRPENAGDYLECGADAVAFGGSIYRSDWITNQNYDQIETELGRLVCAVDESQEK